MELTMTGYQMTEVGLIPEDWEVVEINDLFVFQGGSQPVRSTFIFEEKEGYVRLLQIRDYKSDKYASYIPTGLARRACKCEDIMIGRYGPPVFQILKGLEGAYNVALIKAIPTAKIIQQYGWYLLKQESLFEFVDKLSQRSSGQTGVDLVELKKYQLPLPPTKAEQTAIATALSDMDDLIGGLEQLIDKKRAIKEGAMQVLLTGKVRLEGFEGEWESKQLLKIAPLQRGFDLPSPSLRQGIFPVVYSNGVENFHAEFMVKGPGVVTGRSGTIGKVHYVKENYWPHNTALWVTNFYGNDPLFLFYLYTSIGLEQYGTGSGVPTLNRNDVHEQKVRIPISLEQTAIAQILSDMDAELAVLGEKLGKYRKIKEGMMQELLTGKIRLNHD